MTASSHGRGRPEAGFATVARRCARRPQGQHAPAERILGEPFGVPLQARQARVVLAAGRRAHLFGRILLGAAPELGGRLGLGVCRVVRHWGTHPAAMPSTTDIPVLGPRRRVPPDLDRRRLVDVLASAGMYLRLSTDPKGGAPPPPLMQAWRGPFGALGVKAIHKWCTPHSRARAWNRQRGRPSGNDGVWVCARRLGRGCQPERSVIGPRARARPMPKGGGCGGAAVPLGRGHPRADVSGCGDDPKARREWRQIGGRKVRVATRLDESKVA